MNLRVSLAFITALNIVAAAFCAAEAVPAKPTVVKCGNSEQGYTIDLTSNKPDKYKIQVTKSGIRADFVNAKCTLVSRAPNWDVVAWHNGDRNIMYVSNADWCHKYHMNKMHWAAELTKPVSVQQDWYKGVPALRCVFPATEVVGLYMQSNVGKKGNKDNIDDVNKAIVICLDLPSGKNSGSVFARIFGMPALPGFPLSVRRVRQTGKTEGTLNPGDIHGGPIANNVFAIPQGYKKVTFRESFFISKAQSENAKALFSTLLP